MSAFSSGQIGGPYRPSAHHTDHYFDVALPDGEVGHAIVSNLDATSSPEGIAAALNQLVRGHGYEAIVERLKGPDGLRVNPQQGTLARAPCAASFGLELAQLIVARNPELSTEAQHRVDVARLVSEVPRERGQSARRARRARTAVTARRGPSAPDRILGAVPDQDDHD